MENLVQIIIEHLQKYSFPVTVGEKEKWLEIQKEIIVQAHLKGQIDSGVKEPSGSDAMNYYFHQMNLNTVKQAISDKFKVK